MSVPQVDSGSAEGTTSTLDFLPHALSLVVRKRWAEYGHVESVRYGEARGMRVEDLLKAKGRDVETIRPDATVVSALHRLTMLGIGALVVSTDGMRVEGMIRSEEHTSELQSPCNLVCRLLLEQ